MKLTPEERWHEARARIEKYIDAVFWQDFGISDPEKKRSVDWILDKLFMPEFLALLEDNWTIWAQDTDGDQKHVEVESGLSYYEAKEKLAVLKEKDSPKYFWILPSRASG